MRIWHGSIRICGAAAIVDVEIIEPTATDLGSWTGHGEIAGEHFSVVFCAYFAGCFIETEIGSIIIKRILETNSEISRFSFIGDGKFLR